MPPENLIRRASDFLSERKTALAGLSEPTNETFESPDRDFALGALVSGSGLDAVQVREFIDLMANAFAGAVIEIVVDDPSEEEKAQHYDSILHGFLIDAFLHGYHTRRLEEAAS